MRIAIGIFIFLMFHLEGLLAQDRVLPIASYFRDQSFLVHPGTPVFPQENAEINLYKILEDSTLRYSAFGYLLYNKELIELHKKEGSLWITPLLDVQVGKGLNDTLARRMQNTRGVRMEGALGKTVFFTTSFYENQAVFAPYLHNYALSRGELYPLSDSTYQQQNGVVPGAARTKYFKTEGLDYAFAMGMVRWQMLKNLNVYWGNQPVFLGSGCRSLFWSDNSLPGMNLRVHYKLGKRWDFQMVRMRGQNLLRRPQTTNVEAFYETKSLSLSSIYFHPNSKSGIGIVETGTWYRGDSLQKTPIQPTYFIPVPGASVLQEAISEEAYSMLGLDVYLGLRSLYFYGQIGMNPARSNSMFYQAGVRIHHPRFPLAFVQLEYNHSDKQAYAATNPRLHATNGNLPLAHPMGSGVDELVFRMHADWNHFFLNAQTNFYLNQNANYQHLLPLYTNQEYINQQVIFQQLELGYRFNRAYGLDLFVRQQYRQTSTSVSDTKNTWISAGIRTQLTNLYSDF